MGPNQANENVLQLNQKYVDYVKIDQTFSTADYITKWRCKKPFTMLEDMVYFLQLVERLT